MKVYLSRLTNQPVRESCPRAVKYYRSREVDSMMDSVAQLYSVVRSICNNGATESRLSKLSKYSREAMNKAILVKGGGK